MLATVGIALGILSSPAPNSLGVSTDILTSSPEPLVRVSTDIASSPEILSSDQPTTATPLPASKDANDVQTRLKAFKESLARLTSEVSGGPSSGGSSGRPSVGAPHAPQAALYGVKSDEYAKKDHFSIPKIKTKEQKRREGAFKRLVGSVSTRRTDMPHGKRSPPIGSRTDNDDWWHGEDPDLVLDPDWKDSAMSVASGGKPSRDYLTYDKDRAEKRIIEDTLGRDKSWDDTGHGVVFGHSPDIQGEVQNEALGSVDSGEPKHFYHPPNKPTGGTSKGELAARHGVGLNTWRAPPANKPKHNPFWTNDVPWAVKTTRRRLRGARRRPADPTLY